jgi:hypothetical protein
MSNIRRRDFHHPTLRHGGCVADGGGVPKDRLLLLRVGGQHSGHREDEA